jgi:hypothetical protein
LEIGIGPAVEVRELAAGVGTEAAERVEALGMGDGERTEEEGIDEAKRGSAGADGESERKNCGGGSDFVFGKLAVAEDGVGTEGIKPGDEVEVAEGFFGLFETAEFEESLAAGFLWCHALVETVVDVELEVGVELGVEVVVEVGFAEEVEKAGEEDHGWASQRVTSFKL